MPRFKGKGFSFEAYDLQTAFVANMMATRFSEPISFDVIGGAEAFPALSQASDRDVVAEWAAENGYPSPNEMLFRHVHRKEGRERLQAALDSFVAYGFRSSWNGLPQPLVDAGECAETLRAMPLPYPTDKAAKDENERIRREKQAGKAPKLPGAGQGSGEIVT